jgi:hypothetical protein
MTTKANTLAIDLAKGSFLNHPALSVGHLVVNLLFLMNWKRARRGTPFLIKTMCYK